MKKMIVMLVVVLMAVFCANAFAENYALVTMVVDVDYAADMVEIVDSNGNLWQFEGCEDWENGDLCACLMDDNSTEDIYDDMILAHDYNGRLNNFGF